MSRPRTFADRLDWLLGVIPRAPGAEVRFSADDVVAVLAKVRMIRYGGRSRIDHLRAAREWLDAMRAGTANATTAYSRRFIAALEDVFRLPRGYFRDEELNRTVDERIVFANEAAAGGVRVVGPCRVRASDLPPEDLHGLHAQLVDALSGRRPDP
jgi:hypothetical protein